MSNIINKIRFIFSGVKKLVIIQTTDKYVEWKFEIQKGEHLIQWIKRTPIKTYKESEHIQAILNAYKSSKKKLCLPS